MAFSPQEIVASEYLTSTAGAITSANANKQKITKCLVTEQAGVGGTVTFWIVPNGGSRGNDNRVVNAQSIAASEAYSVDSLVGKIISANATVHGQASVGTTDFSVVIDATVFTDPS